MKKFLKYRTHDVAFTSRMPAGIPGDVSRKEGAVIEGRVYDATNPPAAFGQFVVIDGTSFNVRKVLSTDSSASIYGFLVRPFPVSNANTSDGLGTSTPNTAQIADVARKAYANALLQNSTAAALGGQVYTRIAATSGNLVQGGIEAAASSTIASAAKSGGNTGNGTCTALSVKAGAVAGVYTVRARIAGTNTATFDLFDPSGNLVDQQQLSGAGGTAVFSNGQLGFTITDGATDFVVGDGFDITVVLVNVAVPNAIFTGAADSSGNVEIAYRQ